MSEHSTQHIGDDQLIHGLPKHMAAVASGSGDAYWEIVPGKNACFTCQAMRGRRFATNPGPVHPNCTCEIRRVVKQSVSIDNMLQGNNDRKTERFGAGQKITVRIFNLGPFFAGVKIWLDQMEWYTTPYLRPGSSFDFVFTKFGEPPVTWELSLIYLGGDNSTIMYSIRG